MRTLAVLITLLPLATACSAPDATSPRANLTVPKPAFDEGDGDDSSPSGGGYACPNFFINKATIPGNIYPYHTTLVGAAFKQLEYMQTTGYSTTGIPKGRYAVPPGPWVSADDSIAIVSGNVQGWCLYTKISNVGFGSYTGNLQVVDFDGEVINLITPPPEEENAPTSCDDPFTDEIENDCEEFPSGPSVGGGEPHTFSPGGTTPTKLVCLVTDWYESYNGGPPVYVDTVIDACWFE